MQRSASKPALRPGVRGLVCAAVAVASCAGQPPVSVAGGATDETSSSDTSGIPAADAPGAELPGAVIDASGTDTAEPCEGCGRAPCGDNGDCLSGYCITGPAGKECADPCVDTCPAGYACEDVNVGGDTIFLCVYAYLSYCLPCRTVADCSSGLVGESTTRCLSQGPALGAFCAAACEADADCPEGARCAALTEEQTGEPGSASDSTRYCQPDDGECGCSYLGTSTGASTACSRTNEHGTCEGERACTDAGLTPCDARVPAAEVCNGQDDDCDGETDEGIPGAGGPCDGTDADLCQDGTLICTPGGDALTCDDDAESSVESCNGLDDDCDGDTDGADASLPATPCEMTVGACAGAVKPASSCESGTWSVCGPEVYAALGSGYEPGVESSCDGVDNDCDGATDEDFTATLADGTVVTGAGSPCGAGACSGGVAVCAAEAPGGLACSTAENAGEETCNGKDDDCDGQTDAGDPALLRVSCELSAGVCGGVTKPVGLCTGGTWGPCGAAEYAGAEGYEPGTELSCDGRDNDCDGSVDEDFALPSAAGAPVVGAGQPCGTGACAGGTTLCTEAGTGVTCSSASNATAEVCDGEDNDCDGAVDAADSSLVLVPCGKVTGACAGAMRPAALCAGGVWSPCTTGVYTDHDARFQAGTELACDDVDNDCDGTTDEDFAMTQADGTVVQGAGKPCGTGACASSQTVCAADGISIFCSAEAGHAPETCDTIDDDCDGYADAADPSLVVTPCENQTGECLGAMHPADLCLDGLFAACDASAYAIHAPAYEGGAEATCDGRDNDCDGGTDEDFSVTSPSGSVVSGVGKGCGEGACAGGVTQCTPDGSELRCSTADRASPEVCNGKDDDCDGLIDAADDSMATSFCGRQAGVCEGVIRPAALCVAGAFLPCPDAIYAAWSPDYDGAAEARCDGQDNDCDGATDEDFTVTSADGTTTSGTGKPCGTGACDGGVTACAPGGAGTLCTTAGKADAEVCNGKDDDCDGSTDAADASLEPSACEKQAGVCAGAMKPPALCSGGQWSACGPSRYGAYAAAYQVGVEKACDGLDNDCDGGTDEDFSVVLLDGTVAVGAGAPCGTGGCGGGETACAADGARIVCEAEALASEERCNGQDDDCDGKTDAADPNLALVPCDRQAGVCAGATRPKYLCVDGGWLGCESVQYGPSWEKAKELSCDGLDNDCDGGTDEDFSVTTADGAVLTGVAAACGAGACASGLTQCDAAGSGVVCSTAGQATPETCNGKDDDCDGRTDTADASLVVPGCEKQGGVCTGAVKPLARCVSGSWAACTGADYAAWSPAYADGAESVCDGIDDDCDGATDEDFTVTGADGTVVTGTGKACGAGACAGGVTFCTAAKTGVACSTALAAGPEICDGVDNDCDGLTDAADPSLVLPLCEKQAGVCGGLSKPKALCAGVTGWQPCGAPQYGAWSASYEADLETACDGKDNDCDGNTDEDFTVTLADGAAVTGVGKPCGVGVCAGGTTACDAAKTGLRCMSESGATAEVCDALDNDCDGLTDGADPGLARVVCEKTVGVCAGVQKPGSLCAGGAWKPCSDSVYGAASGEAYTADVETACDGKDNDCDGGTDEDFTAALLNGTTVAGVGTPCGTGKCAGGVTACQASKVGIACVSEATATPETCDGVDDDCDGKTDAADASLVRPPCELQSGVCGGAEKPASLCALGTWSACGAAEYAPTWQPGIETACDGLDNDCDGDTDEDFAVTTADGAHLTGVGVACGVGVCASGVTECNAAGTGVACSTADDASVETCNGLDDDCDGKLDAADASLTLPACEKQTGVCAGAKKPASLCASGTWAACGTAAYTAWSAAYRAGTEGACDAVDEDCDGATDEDFSVTLANGTTVTGAGASCGTGACAGGTLQCNAQKTAVACSTSVAASPEVCDGVDNDCDGLTDGQDPSLALVACEKQAGVCSGSQKPVALCGGSLGWQACGATEYAATSASYQASAETACDGKDNDCDGGTDEDFTVTLPNGAAVTGAGAACGVGLCAGGTTVCTAAMTGIRCSTDANVTGETCDAKDNDCDGKTDAADPSLVAVACEKVVGVCAGSTKPPSLCAAGAWKPCPDSLYGSLSGGTYTAGAEVACDSKDNDCDGGTDEDFTRTLLNGATVTGVGAACGAGKCAGGVTVCQANGLGTICASESGAVPEICNALDDDCDGTTDAADTSLTLVTCELQAGVCAGTQKPKTLCVGGAWQACGAAQYPATWQNGVETKCDGLDNDCNGTKDEDFTMTTPDGVSVSGVGAACGTGLCAGGTTKCDAAGTGTICSTGSKAVAEVCNNVDDDCDGVKDAADASLVKPNCEKQSGICQGAKKPASLCTGGAWSACTTATYTAWNAAYKAASETQCDGLNEDCDSKTDEDFTLTQSDGSVVTGAGSACGTGACANGTTACNGAKTGIVCGSAGSAQIEVCDGVDNDCDGLTDVADSSLVIPSCEVQVGVCAGAVKVTSLCAGASGWQPCTAARYLANDAAYQSGAETACDSKDNDCDDATDEDFTVTLKDGTTVTGAGQACGAGVCSGGTTACNAGKTAILCTSEATATSEICDGLDNDCDGLSDGADPSLVLVACEKTTGVCTGATKTAALCGGAPGWDPCPTSIYTTASAGTYTAGTETACDSKDNDCDGATDEDFSVTLLDGTTTLTGIGKACGLGACAGGVTACNAAKTGVVCTKESTATAEVCDGVDNNCNGRVDAADDALTLAACELTAGVCAGSHKPKYLCSSGSWLPCDAIQYGASWQSGVETLCDGLDNDCSGQTDEDFTMTTAAGTTHTGVGVACGVGRCAGGTTQCNGASTGTFCSTGAQAITEVCNGVDDDCDGATDAADATLVKPSCEKQAGVCQGATKTAALCAAGAWGPCVTATYTAWAPSYQAVAETACDGIDEDCSGVKDEDFTLAMPNGSTVTGVGAACGVGACASGTTLCLASKLGIQCSTGASVSAEVCDGIDNDCDGKTDAADSDLVIPSCEKQSGVCSGSKKPTSLCAGASGWQVCGTTQYVAANAAYQAGAELACDSKDNDCDGSTDEDFSVTLSNAAVVTGAGKTCGVGVCAGGVTACNAAKTGIVCPTEANAVSETCDGKDNDCDGKADAADTSLLLIPCEKTAGVCSGAMKTKTQCASGVWKVCPASIYTTVSGGLYTAGTETACDGKDNDCDAATDEDFSLTQLDGTTVVAGLGKTCGVGACAGGVTACNATKTGIVCPTEATQVTAEVCDGVDNNCNGRIDSADDALALVPCELTTGVCAGAQKPKYLCSAGSWQPCDAPQYGPSWEKDVETRCDGLDNDCSGATDEDFTAVTAAGVSHTGVGVPCGVGLCASGATLCNAGGTGTVCSTESQAIAEACNGVDDDCDGKTDGADPTLVKPACEKQAGICQGSTKTTALCTGGVWGACTTTIYRAWAASYQPTKETACDGIDEDCSGAIDEDFTLTLPNSTTVSGVGAACGVGACAGGSTLCLTSKLGIQCSTGSSATAEVCDGVDNDCDGKTDTADPDLVVPSCEKQSGVCSGSKKPASLCAGASGWQACGNAQYFAYSTAWQAGTETSCDSKDNDCDGSTDEDFSVTLANAAVVTGAGRACGVGVCTGGTTQCNTAQTGIVCSSEASVAVETCDSLDNDCDGKTDAADGSLALVACEKTVGVCTGATKTKSLCVNGTWGTCPASLYGTVSGGTYSAGTETACDGKDNDCDAGTDEDFQLTLKDGVMVEGIGKACGAGVCSGGTTACNAAKTGITCPTETAAVAEVCDGLDNDCDATVDAADGSLTLPVCELQSGACTGTQKPPTLCVSGAWQACGAAEYQAGSPLYQATETLCDTEDNDCNGKSDDIALANRPLNPNQLGVCASTRQQCSAGAWTVAYPATYGLYEEPAGAFSGIFDENCDGIDGTIASAVFVSKSGDDQNPCTQASPCLTIARGLDASVASGATDVYVQGNAYPYEETIVLRSNKRIYGGYGPNWKRAQYIATVQGGLVGGIHAIAVMASGVTGAKIGGLTIRAADAVGANANRGRSSYVVYALDSSIALDGVSLVQGAGAPGPDGADGVDASQTAAAAGANGAQGEGAGWLYTCNATISAAGGAGGSNADCSGTSGGAGGNGGTMDSSCPPDVLNLEATRGGDGATGLVVPLGGAGGAGGTGASVCGVPTVGNPGERVNGAGGIGAAATPVIVNGYFFLPTGSSGGVGKNGGGGGGGGASGGCDIGSGQSGSGGGGGGAGGCKAASGGGKGGGSGGSSFAIFAIGNTTVTAFASYVTMGAGGNGGRGGDGGAGQPGGKGGAGGPRPYTTGAAAGAAGGKGGHGGHGGGGGGGAGGWTVLAYAVPPAVIKQEGTGVYVGIARAGLGGPGGNSALKAPAADRDGYVGGTGAKGVCDTTTPYGCP